MHSPRLTQPLDTGRLPSRNLDELVIAHDAFPGLVSPPRLLFSPGREDTQDRELAAVQASRPLYTRIEGHRIPAIEIPVLVEGQLFIQPDLAAEFTVRAKACDAEGAVLELLPRKAASYQRLTLGVVLPAGDITWTELVDLLGNTPRLDFNDLAFDTKPEASLFSFEPPPGTKIIDIAP